MSLLGRKIPLVPIIRKMSTERMMSAASAIAPTLSCDHRVLLETAILRASVPQEFPHVRILGGVQVSFGAAENQASLIHDKKLRRRAAGSLRRPLNRAAAGIVAEVGHQMPVQEAMCGHDGGGVADLAL